MPLTWDLSAIKDWEDIKTDEEWPTTNVCIFLTMHTGIGSWTEANAAEVYSRAKLLERLYGAFLFDTTDGKHTEVWLSTEDIRRRIGLRTNVGPTESRASFLKRHVGYKLDDEARAYTRAERDRLAAAESLVTA
jgi:hypothetical protein